MQVVIEMSAQDSKTDRPGIYKTADGYLINKDNDALAAYKKRKRKEQAVDRMQEQLDELRSDISEIKDILRGLAK